GQWQFGFLLYCSGLPAAARRLILVCQRYPAAKCPALQKTPRTARVMMLRDTIWRATKPVADTLLRNMWAVPTANFSSDWTKNETFPRLPPGPIAKQPKKPWAKLC